MENRYKTTTEDQAYIDAGVDVDDKAFRKSIIEAAIALNGANDNAQPGVAVSYIPEENYARIVNIKGIADKQLEIIEQALNWNALGRGKGGLAGAAVRWRLRGLIDLTRETILITEMNDNIKGIIKEFLVYLGTNRTTSSVWYSNAWNVMGLATSCFIRESHHWDANNVRPIKALLGSLNQENEIPESEYRKLFYLSIHPIPLTVMAITFFKAVDPLDVDISATVKTRLNVAPSGYADLCACAIAAESFIHEDFASKCLLLPDILKIIASARQLKLDPISFHPFASSMGMVRKELAKSPLTEAMIVLGAYAKSCIGGTLANSPALIKFLDLHARKVIKLTRGFNEYNERKSDDLVKVLTGEDSTNIEVVIDKIKPLAKLSEKLKNMTDDPQSAILKAAAMVDGRLADVVAAIGTDKAGHPLTMGELETTRGLVPFVLNAELARKFNVDPAALKRVADVFAAQTQTLI